MGIIRNKKIAFESTSENIHLVEKFVEEISNEYNITRTYFGNILIAITEAIENAIKHGNNNNPEKKVVLSFNSESDGLSFTIEDEGKGFDFENVPDPTEINNSNEKEGRGIYLIKTLADEVKFEGNGSKISLQFNIASINQKTAEDRIKHLQMYSNKKTAKKKKADFQG